METEAKQKVCKKCTNNLPLEDFKVRSNICKKCVSLKRKEYRKTSLVYKETTSKYNELNKEKFISYKKEYNVLNADKIKPKQKSYVEKNKEKVKEYKAKWLLNNPNKRKISANNYAKNNLSKSLEYQKEKRKFNIEYKIKGNLRGRLYKALNGLTKSNSTLTLIGCSVSSLKVYLEKKFLPTMTWENYGSLWHIDHIVPCSSFNLTLEEEQKKCFHYTNLQPLFATTQTIDGITYLGNINKGDKILYGTEKGNT